VFTVVTNETVVCSL